MSLQERFSSYGSRKFIVTIAGMTLTFILALTEKMTGDVGMVMAACIAGYHLSNAYVTGKGGES